MARIIGVEVPPNKRIDIALRYIYGIGPVNALEILERANIDRATRAKDFDRAAAFANRSRDPEGKYVIEGDSAPRDRHEFETTARHQMLSRRPAHARIARARSTHANERPHAQRPAQNCWRAAQPERQSRHHLKF